MSDIEISPQEVEQMRKSGTDFALIDVREPWEYDTARIEGSILIPMRQVPQRVNEIPAGKPVIVHCHHGGRSLQVVYWLRQNAVEAKNLAGGIDRWSAEIDPNVPRY
jgi:rhodanese-related sulfurtransferase